MTPADAPSPEPRSDRLRRIEVCLGHLLRVGVGVSFVLLLGGVLLMLFHHSDYLTDPGAMTQLRTPGAASPAGFSTLIADLARLRGRAIMTVGLLVLIATPVARVAVSIVAFLIQRDWRFVCITASVLLVIALSAFLGRVR
jgi:uncharacterized membrane protein